MSGFIQCDLDMLRVSHLKVTYSHEQCLTEEISVNKRIWTVTCVPKPGKILAYTVALHLYHDILVFSVIRTRFVKSRCTSIMPDFCHKHYTKYCDILRILYMKKLSLFSY